MDRSEALHRLGEARVARIATADAAGVPHIVPFVFALVGRTVYWAVDEKPKRSSNLRRLSNIRANPNVDVVVDHYEEDWDRLWWVRAAGTARLVDDERERERALEALSEKYPQDRLRRPRGVVVAVDLLRWSGWEATASGAGGSPTAAAPRPHD